MISRTIVYFPGTTAYFRGAAVSYPILYSPLSIELGSTVSLEYHDAPQPYLLRTLKLTNQMPDTFQRLDLRQKDIPQTPPRDYQTM